MLMNKNLILIGYLLISLSSRAQIVCDSFLIDNHYRVFYFDESAQNTNNASLIFILHGTGGKPQNMMKRTNALQEEAKKENIILVYPEGYKNGWNDCRKASTVEANRINIDENTFFDKMITYFKNKYQIDGKKIFAIGFSGGGHMTYKLAMTMPEKFKAITAIVANIPDTSNMDCIVKKTPMAVMIVNGTADPINPYNGGEVKTDGIVLGNVRSTNETVQYWANIDGYNTKRQPSKETIMGNNAVDRSAHIEKEVYKKKNKPEVVLLKVINGKHEFPTSIDIFLEAWNFFKRQNYSKNKQ